MVDDNQPITTRAIVNASFVCRYPGLAKELTNEFVLRYHTAVLTVPAAGHAGLACVYLYAVKATQIFENGIFRGLFLGPFHLEILFK